MIWGSKTTGLERFVEAQDPIYDAVVAELSAGRKRTHWMWFVFPQLKGLGRSGTALHYGIDGRAEAEAYWRHDLLRARLSECTRLVLTHPDESAHAIFGSPDDLKLKSCMTLFETVAQGEPAFASVLDHFYTGERDHTTLTLLGAGRERQSDS
jgi:uncharacterized protein (DUF1810 family)